MSNINISEIIRLISTPRVIKLLMKRRPVSLSSFRNVGRIKKYITKFNTILDVGANKGQFSLAASYFYPEAELFLFEPNKEAFGQINKVFSDQGKIHIFDYGLGDSDGEIDFYANSFDQISSFLKIDLHNSNSAYKLSNVNRTTAVIHRLDTIKNSIFFRSPVLLKLDVQGLEDKVLKGANSSLNLIDFILLEVAFERLYENQLLFHELNELLNNLGYQILAPVGFNIGDDNKLIEMDALYSKVK